MKKKIGLLIKTIENSEFQKFRLFCASFVKVKTLLWFKSPTLNSNFEWTLIFMFHFRQGLLSQVGQSQDPGKRATT